MINKGEKMEKKSKEQCIEWFVKKIEESGILKGIIEADDIRDVLQNNIENVVYNHEYDAIDVFAADWNADEGTLRIGENIKDKEYDGILIHEMLHALSTEYLKDGSDRVGFARYGYAGTTDMNGNQLKESLGGVGINEGMTEYLTGKVLEKESDTYYAEQRIVKLLELFAGKDNLLNDYIHGTEKSKELIDSKYGQNIFERISSIRDKITSNNNAIYANYKRIDIYGDEDKFYECEIERIDNECKNLLNDLNGIFVEMADIELKNSTSIERKLDFLREFMNRGKNKTASGIYIQDISSTTLNDILEQANPELITQYKDIFDELNAPSIENLISQYQNGELVSTSRGNSSQCYVIDDNNVLLVRNDDEEAYDKYFQKNEILQQKLSVLKQEGVNVSLTKGTAYDNGKIFVLQERANGKTLYHKGKNSSEEILDTQKLVLGATEEQLQKYISDYFTLMDADISWDSSAGNLLYDKENGFSFIDLDDKTFYNKEDIINRGGFYGDILKALVGPVEGMKLGSELTNSTKTVLEKALLAMKNYPENEQGLHFSDKTLEKAINDINGRFDFNIDKDVILRDKKTEDIKIEQENDTDLSTTHSSDSVRDEINTRMNINATFRRTDVKKIATNAKARDVQSTQSELKSNYREIMNPIMEIDNDKMVDDV